MVKTIRTNLTRVYCIVYFLLAVYPCFDTDKVNILNQNIAMPLPQWQPITQDWNNLSTYVKNKENSFIQIIAPLFLIPGKNNQIHVQNY